MKLNQGQSEFASARDPVSRAVLHGAEAIKAGLKGRCPNCGQGRLFAGFLKISPQCTACGFDLAKVETGDGAATFIMQIAGAVVGFSALAIELRYHPPIGLHLAIWPLLVVALSLGLMRPGKGLMIALNMLRLRDE